MKQFEDYSEDIYKCTKCGLCQSVCPVFETTGNETLVSRGFFTLLNGIILGKIKLNKKVSKKLQMCLGCKACDDFCPSGISAEEIISKAKYIDYKQNGGNILKKTAINCLKSHLFLSMVRIACNLYRKTGISYVVKQIKPIGLTVDSLLKETIKYKKLNPEKHKSSLKILYFPGCVSEYINPSVKNAVKIVLEKNGFEVLIPEKSVCCGIPAKSSGDLASFVEMAKKNLEKISDDIDFLITDCASCGSVWHDYVEILEGDYKQKAEKISKKTINIYDFLLKQNIYIPEDVCISRTITYHDPCHLKRFQGVSGEIRSIFSKIKGINFVEMEEADKCCGTAGLFCVINPEISTKITNKKVNNVINTNCDELYTSCPACKAGIMRNLYNRNADIPVKQVIELLAEAYLKEK